MDKHGPVYRVLMAIGVSTLLLGTLAVAQPRTQKADNPPAAASAAPVPNDREVAETQTELIRLLRLSPTLTTVVSHDPSLLSNQEYVARNNPQLAAFLAAHPDVARNPEFYLFSHLKHSDGEPDEALERAVWPDVYRQQPEQSGWYRFWDSLVPLLAFVVALIAILWLARVFVENRRWNRIFKMQSDVHTRLIDKFTSNQELATYMQTEAGRKFLEAAPIPVAFEQNQRVPSAVGRVLTPLQTGIVMVLLGIGLLSLQHVGPDTQIPMRILGIVVLMPGIGFIISAGVSWLLASRLGLMPETAQSGLQSSTYESVLKDRQ
ncbi:MAG TPA: hypothetical protein VGI45_11565 [Terracidiphilus sp.]|jgi:hypothetical protein